MTTPTKESLALAREWLEESQQRQWKVKEFSLATLLDRAKDEAIEKCAALAECNASKPGDVIETQGNVQAFMAGMNESMQRISKAIRALKVTP